METNPQHELVETVPWQKITKEALVSIIIPSKDNVQVLLRCLHTLLEKTQYPQYELVIVDNGSTEENRQWITSKINELQGEAWNTASLSVSPTAF